jgi:hypothetical protein
MVWVREGEDLTHPHPHPNKYYCVYIYLCGQITFPAYQSLWQRCTSDRDVRCQFTDHWHHRDWGALRHWWHRCTDVYWHNRPVYVSKRRCTDVISASVHLSVGDFSVSNSVFTPTPHMPTSEEWIENLIYGGILQFISQFVFSIYYLKDSVLWAFALKFLKLHFLYVENTKFDIWFAFMK